MTGLSHRSAPLAVREAISLTRDQLPDALHGLREHSGGGVIVSTCNRTEIYTVARDTEHGHEAVDAFLSDHFGVNVDRLKPHLYALDQEQAVDHLFRVTAGLDSLILGESEILGQVRDAYGVASREGMASGVLAHVFHSALRTGKRARTETGISRNALSVSRACVELARRALGDLTPRRALIAGVGEASRLAAQALSDAGVTQMVVANRSTAHAVELAVALGCEAVPLDALEHELSRADVVVTSTAAPDFVVSRQQVADAMGQRPDRPLLIVDIAVPRDVEPSAAEVVNVHLHTLDDLEAVAEANRRERQSEASKVEHIVRDEVQQFQHWWDARGLTPTIAAMRHQAEEVRAAEVARTLSRMDGLDQAQAERIEAMTKAIIKKLLHEPTTALRARKDESFTQSARELFGLDEPPS